MPKFLDERKGLGGLFNNIKVVHLMSVVNLNEDHFFIVSIADHNVGDGEPCKFVLAAFVTGCNISRGEAKVIYAQVQKSSTRHHVHPGQSRIV